MAMIWRCDLVPQYLAFQKDIREATERVLGTGRYILSGELRCFEEEFAGYLGAKAVVGVANGTDGLILALRAVGVGPGDEVVTTPFTAIPTVAAIRETGAQPVFVDVCEDSYLMDVEQVPAAVTPRTKAIMPVHIFGNVVDIGRLRELAGPQIPIVEDACQAHGSTLFSRQAGAMGTLGVFSFYPTKNLGACGDGGAVAVGEMGELGLAEQLRLWRMYGMVDKDHFVQHGINSRLDELQAAILRAKLPHLDAMNGNRVAIAQRYRTELRPDLWIPQAIAPGCVSNYHVYVGRVPQGREALATHLEKCGIQTNVYYPLPLYRQPGISRLYEGLSLPRVERLCEQVLALPMYPELPPATLDKVIACFNHFQG
jgi:dTDP-4-amino-4,6-dideoxygalactose transaminase